MAGAYYYQQHVEPILPQTVAPAVPRVSMWFVDRLPYGYPRLDSRQALALNAVALAEQIIPTILPSRPVAVYQNSAAQMVYSLGHVYYPQNVGPVFPQPTISAVVSFAPLQQDYNQMVPPRTRPNVAHILNAVINGQFKGLLSVPVSQLGWPVETPFPNRFPNRIAAQQSIVGGTPPPQPQVVPTPTLTLASYLSQWQPQFNKPWPYAQIEVLQALVQPILSQPFVPTPAPSVAGYFQNLTWQQWSAGRHAWITHYTENVSNTLPIPFIPPPPPICKDIPEGFDRDTKISSFIDGSGKPIAVLLCRVCHSGLPLLVRGDYAIWCQTCCAFVSKQDTYMGTTQAPSRFRDIF